MGYPPPLPSFFSIEDIRKNYGKLGQVITDEELQEELDEYNEWEIKWKSIISSQNKEGESFEVIMERVNNPSPETQMRLDQFFSDWNEGHKEMWKKRKILYNIRYKLLNESSIMKREH